MQSEDAERALRQILGPDLGILTPRATVPLMLSFYRDVRANDVEVEEDGDMMLVQWGTYDWGEGEHFSFNITRQFITAMGEDEDIRQLGVTFRYPPETSLRELGSANRWCHRPEDVAQFQLFIEESEVFQAVANRHDAIAEIAYQGAV